MRNLRRAAVRAFGGGRFLTVWSIAASLPLSLTVMAPTGVGIDTLTALPAMVATWLCFAAALTGIAAWERRGRSRRERAAVVTAGIVVCAAMRPVMQDGWLHLAGLPAPPSGQLPYRIATNIVVWMIVLSIIAVLDSSLRSLRRTNALLRSVAQELARAQDDAHALATDARNLLDRAQSTLDAAIIEMEPTSAGVRRLGDEWIREWSHRLAELAEKKEAGNPRRARDGFGDRADPRSSPSPRYVLFRLPPPGLVTLIYTVCLLPYATRTQTPLELLIGIAALAAGGAVVDFLPRRRAIARVPHHASLLFMILSCVVGIALAALAAAQGVAPLLAAVSAIAYIGFAFAAGTCAGALHRLRSEQHRLSSAVADAQQLARAGTRPTRDGLRAAADLLHADAQGACILFALAHPTPDPDDIRRLRAELATVVSRLPEAFATADDPRAHTSLTALFETWAHVIELRVDVDDEARDVLSSIPWVVRDCYDIVAEGLLNAAKHASERRAEVSIRRVTTGAGPRLHVRVSSPGIAARGTRLRASSRMQELGAHLVRIPGGVALEAAFALPLRAAVVSTEHRDGEHPTPP